MAVHKKLNRAKYQCDICTKAYDYNARRAMRCGYVSAADWKDAGADTGYIAGCPVREPETCPGYTTQLPHIAEVASAWAWWEKGQLGMRADVPDAIAELVSLFNGEIVAARTYYLEESKKG
jgi:hypothetical protein